MSRNKPPKVENKVASSENNTVYNTNIRTRKSGYRITRVVYNGAFADEVLIRFTDSQGQDRRFVLSCEYYSRGRDDNTVKYVQTPRIKIPQYEVSEMQKEVIDAVVGRELQPVDEEIQASPMILQK